VPRRRRCTRSSQSSLPLYPTITVRRIREAPRPLGHLPGDAICTWRPQPGWRNRLDLSVGRRIGPMGTMDLIMTGELTTQRRTRSTTSCCGFSRGCSTSSPAEQRTKRKQHPAVLTPSLSCSDVRAQVAARQERDAPLAAAARQERDAPLAAAAMVAT
jgi:hypothetical protein